jgi:hypothetical protein
MFRNFVVTSTTTRLRQFKPRHSSSFRSRFSSILAVCSTSALVAAPTSVFANYTPVPFSTTTKAMTTPTTTIDSGDLNMDLWNGSDPQAFEALDHPGYALESDPITFLGGWHAHRAVWEPSTKEDGSPPTPCWIKDDVMEMITRFDYQTLPIGRAPRILVLYGSLRPTSFSRNAAYEFARLLDLLGCDIRIYNPRGLPVRDPALEQEAKVQELRALTLWRYVTLKGSRS